MNALVFLVPTALFLGLLGLGAFFWSLRTNQYEDLEGAGWRILADDEADMPGVISPPSPADPALHS
jgi:cbb3-type cytochrome oxidase maturation protein